jgi:hypothetical protein
MTIPKMDEEELLRLMKAKSISRFANGIWGGYIIELKEPIRIEGKSFKKIFLSEYDDGIGNKGWEIRGIKYKHLVDEREFITDDSGRKIKEVIKALMNEERLKA